MQSGCVETVVRRAKVAPIGLPGISVPLGLVVTRYVVDLGPQRRRYRRQIEFHFLGATEISDVATVQYEVRHPGIDVRQRPYEITSPSGGGDIDVRIRDQREFRGRSLPPGRWTGGLSGRCAGDCGCSAGQSCAENGATGDARL